MLESLNSRLQYAGDGSTSAFPITFYFVNDEDIRIIKTDDDGVDTELTFEDDFTLSGAGDEGGGTATLIVTPSPGETITIFRDPVLTQDLALETNDELPVEEVEKALDKLTMIAQRLDSRMDRSLVVRETDEDSELPLQLPSAEDRAGMFLGFDDDGNPIAATNLDGDTAISGFIATLVDDASAAEARATLGFSGVFGRVSSENLDISVASALLPIINGTFEASVAGGALTVALKTNASANPSASSPVICFFRVATAASGAYERVDVSAATSLVISSGSTLGATNGQAFRLWLVMFNDGGTVRLGLINCKSGTNIYPLQESQIVSSTAEGGAGAADSAQVFYSGTAVTSKAMRVLGYLEWSAGLATAGTWDTAPTKVQMMSPGVPLPGRLVQSVYNPTGATATGSTTIPLDDTVPQNTEGDQYLTQAITPISAANILAIEGRLCVGQSTDNVQTGIALFQDSTASALAAALEAASAANAMLNLSIYHEMLAGTTSATTFKLRAGGASGAVRLNGQSGRLYGGVVNSYLRVQEIMG